jgi:carbamoyltransferase
MKVIGISAYYHDSAVALIEDGNISYAAQEERFTRIKHDANFPHLSLKDCLNRLNLSVNDIDYFCFYEKPFLKFERLLETYLTFAPKGFKSFSKAMPIWVKEKLFQKTLITKELIKLGANKNIENKIIFSEHHLSHAASAYYPSPFDNAAILTLDGVGEWATTTLGIGQNFNIDIIKEIHFPHSLGLLYSAFTYYCGFKVNSGEYKLMGLAPYGTPKYKKIILDNLIDIKEDGSFRLNMKYFAYCTELKMTNTKFNDLFRRPPRLPETEITNFYMDIASSIQNVLETIVLKMCKNIKKVTKQSNLCMAGGVALNCVINGKIANENIFDNIWIQPAAGDAGGALGAALLTYYAMNKNYNKSKKENLDKMKGSFLGPSYNNDIIKKELERLDANAIYLGDSDLINEVSNRLSKNEIVGWFQGNMEFGPRALGNRSILANPSSKKMQKDLNLKIKFRENFRPFAPAVLRDKTSEWFNFNDDSPYMLMVSSVKNDKLLKKNNINLHKNLLKKINEERSKIPAVTHVDNTARLQTVDSKDNNLFYNLIKNFYKITGIPMLINTSFNIRNEPIVCTPEDSFRCFMGTSMDILVIGNFILYKNKQNKKLLINYKNDFKMD